MNIQNTLILGAGASGEAAAALIIAKGGTAAILDSAWKPERRQAAQALGARTLETFPEGEAFTLCVASPSIPIGHTWLTQCAARKIPVVSELQLGAAHWQGKALAVTGSKGKSSLVKLCTDTLTRAGRIACTAGNYGTPLSARVLEYPDAHEVWAVTEVSTFQMEHTAAFAPQAACILNLQADHLDRHAHMTEYGDLKRKLLTGLPPASLALIPQGFDLKAPRPHQTFGDTPPADWRYTPGLVQSGSLRFTITGPFDNPILGLAAAAACALLTAAGLTPAQIEAGFAHYQPLAHRMQRILDHRGVTCIDDSKATSLSATAAALKMCAPRPVRLIAGGLLKEEDTTFIKTDLANHAKKVYLIGDCAQRLFDAWSRTLPCALCGTMEKAVDQATAEALPGEVILLSPGTASFDQYPGYAARGNDFQNNLQRRCVGKP